MENMKKLYYFNMDKDTQCCKEVIYMKFRRQEIQKDGRHVVVHKKGKLVKDRDKDTYSFSNKYTKEKPMRFSVMDIYKITIDDFDKTEKRQNTLVFKKEELYYSCRISNSLTADIELAVALKLDLTNKDEWKNGIVLSDEIKKDLVFIKCLKTMNLQLGFKGNPSISKVLDLKKSETYSKDKVYCSNGRRYLYLGDAIRNKFKQVRMSRDKIELVKIGEEKHPLFVNSAFFVYGYTEDFILDSADEIVSIESFDEFKDKIEFKTDMLKDCFSIEEKRIQQYNAIIKKMLIEVIFGIKPVIQNREGAIEFSNFNDIETEKRFLDKIERILSNISILGIEEGSIVNTNDILKHFDIEMKNFYPLADIDNFKAGDCFMCNGRTYFICKTSSELNYTSCQTHDRFYLVNKERIFSDSLLVIEMEKWLIDLEEKDFILRCSFIDKSNFSYLYKISLPTELSEILNLDNLEELREVYKFKGDRYEPSGGTLLNKDYSYIKFLRLAISCPVEKIDESALSWNIESINPENFSETIAKLALWGEKDIILNQIKDLDDFPLVIEDEINEYNSKNKELNNLKGVRPL